MAPVLFLFLMTAFVESLEIVRRQQEIPILSIMTTSKGNLIDGKICRHTPAMFTSNKLTLYKIVQCLFVDDGVFPFGTRRDLKKKMELTYHHFGRFRLKMHVGQGTSHPKPNASSSLPPNSSNMCNIMPQWLQQSKGPFVAHVSVDTQHR
jgi:hypothetical protein